jgi:sporulation protein YlmC with PRC-barrel domain
VRSNVIAGDGKKLGTLTTVHALTKAKEIATFIVISPEGVAAGGKANITSVICHHEDRPTDFPAVNYLLAPGTQS